MLDLTRLDRFQTRVDFCKAISGCRGGRAPHPRRWGPEGKPLSKSCLLLPTGRVLHWSLRPGFLLPTVAAAEMTKAMIRSWFLSLCGLWVLSPSQSHRIGHGSLFSIPLGEIAGSYSHLMSNFVRNRWPVFHNSCTVLHSHQQCIRVLISSHLCQYLLFSGGFVCFS